MNSQTRIYCEQIYTYIVDLFIICSTGTKTPGFIDVIRSKTFLIVSGVSALLLIMLVVMICVVKRRRRRHKGICQPLNLITISWLCQVILQHAMCVYIHTVYVICIMVSITFRAFSRCLYPKRLTLSTYKYNNISLSVNIITRL